MIDGMGLLKIGVPSGFLIIKHFTSLVFSPPVLVLISSS
jgi:hypothetical protein